ncbi:SDR family NAD(P)-dependent oxidoreductase [Dickeya dianthicola]|uniref:SDR family oxidoreductase n=1 Tax=Dickeya dianthicola TaxID=204039 RepID=UPI00136E1583|nr:SDR family NAD(P)-dependent oxidoreductase [Dickeya dianthicola]MCI4238313.1 SDR family NAD(P)-dependent oxidoreductase [Dickeya dianthicola]MCI4255378.1 SDR family NAD(P)-dependent oxidoreductase [Dickeya dianthicola]MZG22937.1 SDR family NAD(P)-dependent oxidoreductase [Dickeya dianthicola]MZI91207.1 SDR family NAD(P)-dependent oxidoreductase [Dickeya dianthicola]
MKTSGNTILITGSTSGIGLGLALRFHEAGNRVIVAGRRNALLDKITRDYPGMEAIELDIADAGSVIRASKIAAERYPDLNVVINNAGIMLSENVLDADSLNVAQQTVEINLLGTIRMIYAFLPQLMKKNDSFIINVSSSLAFVPFPIALTYSATKAAVHAFTAGLRVQLSSTPVRVIELAPPGVRTTLFGQENEEHAMPLDDFLDETLDLLHADPMPDEIIVERARYLRTAEATGNYENALEMLSAWKITD